MADGGHFQRTHILYKPRRRNACRYLLADALLVRRTENIFKPPSAESAHGVRRGVSAGQRVQPQAAAVNDRLAQSPEQYRAVHAAHNGGNIRGICEGQILEHDEIRLHGAEKRVERFNAQQHIIRHGKARVDTAQQLRRRFKLRLCTLPMEGRHTRRDVNRGKIFHITPRKNNLLNFFINHSVITGICQQK